MGWTQTQHVLTFLNFFLPWPGRSTDHSSLFYSNTDFANIIKFMQCLNVINMTYLALFRLKKKGSLLCQSGEKLIYIWENKSGTWL